MAFWTTRLEEMIEFYLQILDGYVSHLKPGETAFISIKGDSEPFRVVISTRMGWADRPNNTTGTNHVAFTIRDLNDLFATYKRLEEAGIKYYRALNHGMETSLYYIDPDGNHIELQIYNFDTPEEAIEWMNGSEFAQGNYDPNAANFDPEKMSAMVFAGEVPHSTLKQRRKVADMIQAGDL